MNPKKGLYIVILFATLLVLGYFLLRNYSSDNPIQQLKDYDSLVSEYCLKYGVEKNLFLSIIYSELSLNFDHFDQFDELRARIGLDPSVGITQMKVSTFLWLEKYYGNELNESSNNEEMQIVDKMLEPKINLKYACYYVRLIISNYIEKYNIKPGVEIVGSYYSYGIDHINFTMDSSYINLVGKQAKIFYNELNM